MKKFMIIFGPLSSCFDLITFAVLLWVLGVTGAGFQTGWFLESIATQTFVVLIIRSRGSVFNFRGLQSSGTATSKPSKWLVFSTIGAVALGWFITYSFIGPPLGFVHFGIYGVALILCIVAGYLITVEFAKKFFYRKYGALIEK